jgi:uncharacterized membrane protein
MKKIILLVALLFSFVFLRGSPVFAQNTLPEEETLEAKIVNISGEGSSEKILLEIKNGSLKGRSITIENSDWLSVPREFRIGDRVIVSAAQDIQGSPLFQITDYVRRDALFFLFIIFVVLAVLVARFRGAMSLLGMGLSFLIIFTFVLPQISAGANPVLIAILGSALIIPITFFLSHGINKKTLVAVLGTLIALVVTGWLAAVFVEGARLTGFAAEEAGFLQFSKQGLINIKGLLLAGIIIGVLGILDDITISQSAIVFQLKEINPKMKQGELYRRAMAVGKDHISSMVNTLILVYTGAALPLLLLFIDNPRPLAEVVNYEIIAEEIVRTLTGSIGLILAVPITTLIAAIVVSRTFRE